MTTLAPLVLSIRSLRKDRPQEEGESYSLRIPALDVRLGDKILVTGPSGSGKSTLLDILGLILRPDQAERFFLYPEARARQPVKKGQTCNPSSVQKPLNVGQAWAKGRVEHLALWRRHIGYVLQTGGLLPFISVRENILTPLKLLPGGDQAAETEAALHLAEEMGISPLLSKLPAQLSVGERQRAAIARALAARPALVLADEPTAALDPHNAAGVLELFSHMVAHLGATLLLVTHAPEQMAGMGFRRMEVMPADDTAQGTVMVLRPSGGR